MQVPADRLCTPTKGKGGSRCEIAQPSLSLRALKFHYRETDGNLRYLIKVREKAITHKSLTFLKMAGSARKA